MLSMPLLLVVAVTLIGTAALVAAVAVRTSGQCRHRVAHARVIAQARRIEDLRRLQVMQRLAANDPPTLPGLRDPGSQGG